jgi:formylglycine-generating enzyme required for sulfatase activity
MLGGASEWCADTWHDDYTGAPTDGSAWFGGVGGAYVLRGGSWFSEPWSIRCAQRNKNFGQTRDTGAGFRLALDAD